MKRYLIGIDEAGYGPKIGPLVIGASVWRVPEGLEPDHLLRLLAPEFQSKPWQPGAEFLPFGDSKAIYQDRKHLDSLSLAIRFLLGLNGYTCDSTSNLLHNLSELDAQRVEGNPWYAPTLDNTTWDELPVTETLLRSARCKLEHLGIEFRGLLCRIIDEEEFNRVVPVAGNKANALGEWSLSLLRDSIQTHCNRHGELYGNEELPLTIEACCDRQGGRKRYLPLLDHAFQDWAPWFDVVEENNQCSRYRGRLAGMDLQIRFQVGGDSIMPTGVASILAKWVRELLMQRLNQYWQSQVGNDLKPTAGYPVDADRFRKAIEQRAEELTHASSRWWRCC